MTKVVLQQFVIVVIIGVMVIFQLNTAENFVPKFCDKTMDQEDLSCGACVSKCCGPEQVWDLMKKDCQNVKNGIYWTPSFYQVINKCVVGIDAETNFSNCQNRISRSPSPISEIFDHPLILTINVLKNCSAVLLPFRKIGHIAGQRFRLLINGSVILRDKYGVWHEIRQGNFCIDGIQKSERRQFTGNEADTMIWVCQGEYDFKEIKKPIPVVYAVMLFGSSFLLFITAFVYALLWRQNGVYEWLIFSDVISNLFMIIFVATGHSIGRDPEHSDIGSTHCIIIGVASHFFFLASFTWTFIICFELWWIFRKLGPVSRKSFGLKRLGFYQLAGWGCPGLTVLLGLILDNFYGLGNMEIDCSSITTPNYGLLNCYLSKPAQGPYLFYPIGAILGCNLLFFTLTILEVRRHKKSTKIALQGPESRMTKSRSQLTVVFAKLFSIMGLSWISELVAWLVTSKTRLLKVSSNQDKDTIPLYWIIYDVVIVLQAVAIFFIFTCKSEILFSLWKRYPLLRVILKPFTFIPGCKIPREAGINFALTETSRVAISVPRSRSIDP